MHTSGRLTREEQIAFMRRERRYEEIGSDSVDIIDRDASVLANALRRICKEDAASYNSRKGR